MTHWDRRVTDWVDLVADLARCPATAGMPRAPIVAALAATFEGLASWNEVRADGTLLFEVPELPSAWPGPDEYDWWRDNGPSVHPLIGWYATTQDLTAMTMGRVPTSVVSQRGRAEAVERLNELGIGEQLSIPCWAGPAGSWAFVMARSGDDFGAEDLQLARTIQPLLMLLARQAQVAELPAPDPFGLTGRERAVLSLLCAGLTAAAIGRRLCVSPRTVDKHLERIYRKLGVRDRLTAYQVAVRAGLVRDAPSRTDPHTGSGGTP